MAVCKGWLYVDGFWYWFDDEGIMVVGLTECGSQTYHLNTGSDTSIPCGAMKTARLSKTTIAGHYLPLSWSNNFVTAFAGDPFAGTGGLNGCVAPAIVIAGKQLLERCGKLPARRRRVFQLYSCFEEPSVVWPAD